MSTADRGSSRGKSEPAGGSPGDLGWLLAIGFLSLGLRWAFARQYTAHPLGQQVWVDEGAYWSWAQAIRGGAWLPRRPFYQDPLWAYALAGLMAVAGSEVVRLRLVLACLGALTPCAIYWAARRGLGRAEAIVAGLAAAAYGPLVFADGLLEKEGRGALMAALALGLTALAARHRRSLIAPGAAGLVWGLLALLRANALVIGPLGAVWCVLAFPGDDRARRLTRGLAFFLGFALILTPALVVNLAVSRRPELLLTTWQIGPNFYIGNGPEANGTYVAPEFVEANPIREADDFAAEARRRAGRSLTPGEVSRFWLAAGLARWSQSPGTSLRLFVKKLGLVVHDEEIPDNQDPVVVGLVAAPALGWSALSLGCLAPWAALGLVVGRPKRSPFWWFLVTSTAAGLITTAVFFVVGRYRIPWVPGLVLIASIGAVDAAHRTVERRWPGLAARVALLALPALILAWRPITDPTPDRWGHAEIELALAHLAANQLEPAIDALDDARALGRGPADRVAQLSAAGPVHNKLAASIRIHGQLDRRLGRGSEWGVARRVRQLAEGRVESRSRLEAALEARPDNAPVLRELGAWWLGEPPFDVDAPPRRRAFAMLRRAASGPAGDASAAVLLALATDDPAPLDWPAGRRAAPGRLRLARAALAAHERGSRWTSP